MSNPSITKFLALIALAFPVILPLGSNAYAQTTLISDNFSTNDFNVTTYPYMAMSNSTANAIAWSSSNGVGGVSGELSILAGTGGTSAATQTEVYYNGTGAAIPTTFGTTFTSSIYFFTGSALTDDIAQALVGFTSGTGSNFGGFGSISQVGGSLFGKTRFNSDGSIDLQLYADGVQEGSNVAVTLNSNTWYDMTLSMSLSGSTTASTLGFSLYNTGSSGVSTPVLVNTVSATNVTLTGAGGGFTNSSFYSGFGGGNYTASNLSNFDNFSVQAVPEPSTWALTGLSLAFVMFDIRRRGKQPRIAGEPSVLTANNRPQPNRL